MQSTDEGDEMDIEEKTGEGESEDSVSTDAGIGEIFNGYLALLDEVAQLTRLNFYQVWDMNIAEFFSYVAYSRWKSKKQAENIKKWQSQKNY